MIKLSHSGLTLVWFLVWCSSIETAAVLPLDALPVIHCPSRYFQTNQLEAVKLAAGEAQRTLFHGVNALNDDPPSPLVEPFWKTADPKQAADVMYRVAAVDQLPTTYQVICINTEEDANQYHNRLVDSCRLSTKGIVHFGNEPVQQVPASTIFICPSFWNRIPEPRKKRRPDRRICPQVVTQVNEYQNPERYSPWLFDTQATTMMIAALDVFGGKMFSKVESRVDLNNLLRLPPTAALETQESYYAFAICEFLSWLHTL